MHRRARAIGIALTSASLLASSVLAAAPASAATAASKPSGDSLTAAYCQSYAGPTAVIHFSTVKGVKTCTFTRSYQLSGYQSKSQSGPFDPALGLTADGYDAEWYATTTYYETQTLTQKGKGYINYSPLGQSNDAPQVSNEACYALTYTDAGVSFTPVSVDPCVTLGLFPIV